MHTTGTQPRYISLNRLAKLSGRSRVTLLLRVKDGKLLPDAMLDVGDGRSLPLFHPDKAAQFRTVATKTSHPLM